MNRLPIIILLFVSLNASWAAEPAQPEPFSKAKSGPALPQGWVLNTLPNVPHATRFDLVSDENQTVLRAESDHAAASLTHKLMVNPVQTPWLSWRWKVSRVLDSADLGSKAGDDYAARVYVLFDYPLENLNLADRIKISLVRAFYKQELPAAALCYVWDNRHPIASSAWSTYTDRVRMIVLESGSAQVGLWRLEQRDVAADFRLAFGEEPPPINGLALAADTDNTGETVTAWFGDLAFAAQALDLRKTQP